MLILYCDSNDNGMGKVHSQHAPSKGDYFWVNGEEFLINKVIHNYQGAPSWVKIILDCKEVK